MPVPEHLSSEDIAAYMRDLRLHYGLSEQDVSERLHIRLKYVVAIEQAMFDAMPGQAYARGYVHTYAEFLGLDADQVVARCFGPELAREKQAHSLPEAARRRKGQQRQWGGLVVLLLLGGMAYIALHNNARDPIADTGEMADELAVEAVPEDYLARLRVMPMATPENIDCFTGAPLGCYYAQRLTRAWVVPRPVADFAPAPGLSAQQRQMREEAASAAQAKEEAAANSISPAGSEVAQ